MKARKLQAMPESGNPRHAKRSVEWFTPEMLVEAEREVMGGIDLDPLTCAEANKVIKAEKIYTKRQDGLAPWNPWQGKLHVNPPTELMKPAWQRLVMTYEGRFGDSVAGPEQAIWIGYSLEQLQVLQQGWAGELPMDYPICYVNRRLRFWMSKAQRAELEAEAREKLKKKGKKVPPPEQQVWKDRPSHASYVVYLPPRKRELLLSSGARLTQAQLRRELWDEIAVQHFVDRFSSFGRVVVP